MKKPLIYMIELAGADKRVLAEPAPNAKVTELGDSAVSVTLHCWATPDDWADAKDDLLKAIKETFEAQGLSFPYPHQVSIEAPKARASAAKPAAKPAAKRAKA